MKSQVILRNLQWSGRHNPGFPPGSAQTAVAELLNPTNSILPYRAWLYLEEWAVVGSNLALFNIDAGATKNVNFQITMPTEERVYPVYLKIWSGDQLLETYRAAEDVVIGVAPVTTVTVRLKNPPSRATEWQLSLYDWNKTRIASKYAIAITDPTVFEIPPVTIFPLRMEMMIYHNSTIDYRKQSVGTVFPFPPEWYVKAFIPDYGNYYYNVSTERFEKI